SENSSRALRGELYYAFTPELVAARRRAKIACDRYNSLPAGASRRDQVHALRQVLGDGTPLPEDPTGEYGDEPWVEPPLRIDYGTNVTLGKGVFINFSCTILDTCKVSIGDRCLLASNVSLFSGTHPLDPEVRNGTAGPEYGKEIHIESDCWIGGNVTILPGVRIGRGSTVGAGSVVTK
ncbi:trimeric LpxA-like protein, partial [Piedraia hortae CBS 480.64]